MKKILPFAAIILLFPACQKDELSTPNLGTHDGSIVTDIDGNAYDVITIGAQIWMKENLKVTHYNNGDPILNVTDHIQWINQTSGAYCNYKNSNIIASIYGRLYNWYAVNDARKIAPEGWHVATNDEWMELEFYFGGVFTAGPLKETGTMHWASPNIGATNSSGFTALPGGARFDLNGFNENGITGSWWNTGETFAHFAWFRTVSNDESMMRPAFTTKTTGLSVRCIKD